MCCDRSPAVLLQRYNFPSEQVWEQRHLYVVVALAIRSDFARTAPRTNANEQAKYPQAPSLPAPQGRFHTTRRRRLLHIR